MRDGSFSWWNSLLLIALYASYILFMWKNTFFLSKCTCRCGGPALDDIRYGSQDDGDAGNEAGDTAGVVVGGAVGGGAEGGAEDGGATGTTSVEPTVKEGEGGKTADDDDFDEDLEREIGRAS